MNGLLFYPQGRVCDIIYRGTKDKIHQATQPDGKVPLVSVYSCHVLVQYVAKVSSYTVLLKGVQTL